MIPTFAERIPHLAQRIRENVATALAEDIGSNYGRTLKFDVGSGKVSIRSAKMGNKDI